LQLLRELQQWRTYDEVSLGVSFWVCFPVRTYVFNLSLTLPTAERFEMIR
jgi:hypothetical protein